MGEVINPCRGIFELAGRATVGLVRVWHRRRGLVRFGLSWQAWWGWVRFGRLRQAGPGKLWLGEAR